MEEKTLFREKAIKIRNNIEDRAQKNEAIARRLEELEEFQTAKHLLFYYSVNDEVDTLEIIKKHMSDKQIYLPVMKEDKIFVAVPIESLNLEKGREGVPEPALSEERFEDKIDLIIVPGVAFDKAGNRLGMGKGYYDRYLGGLQDKMKIALAFEEQIFDQIPTESYDEAVDRIVTDKNIYRRNP